MWSFDISPISSSTRVCSIAFEAERLSFGDVLELWASNVPFSDEWTLALAAVPFQGYCLETPPLRIDGTNRAFECAFIESPGLVKATPDPTPFEEFLNESGRVGAVKFRSLGGDALLVAPKLRDGAPYGHLASYVRTASQEESRDLWRTVADATKSCLGREPVWLSTAGLGVSWLHVRVDTRPKYYRHAAYANSRYWELHSGEQG